MKIYANYLIFICLFILISCNSNHSKISYLNDKKDSLLLHTINDTGYLISWHTNGKLKSIELVYKMQKIGRSYSFFSSNGNVSAICFYKKNVFFGEQIFYHSNGFVNFIKYYNGNGNSDSLLRVWDRNRNLIQRGFFNDGDMEGLWHSYYENGKIKELKKYKNGIKDGLWYLMNRHGDTTKIVQYPNNAREK